MAEVGLREKKALEMESQTQNYSTTGGLQPIN
jgi:hypothetical protein